MLTYEFIKTKIDICIFITCAWLVQLLLWAMSSIDVIGEIRIRVVTYVFFFMILYWVLNTQLLVKISKLDNEMRRSLKWNIVGLCFSYIFILISYFVWKNICKKFNTRYEIGKITYVQSKNVFLIINFLYWIVITYAWTVMLLLFTPQFPKIVGSEIMMILSLTMLPAGLLCMGLLIYLLTKFRNVITNNWTNPKFNIYSELIWLTFIFPLLGIWLMIYINKKISYVNKIIEKDIQVLS